MGEGNFSHQLRFAPETRCTFLQLSELYLQVLQTTQSSAAAIIGLVEIEHWLACALIVERGRFRLTEIARKGELLVLGEHGLLAEEQHLMAVQRLADLLHLRL